MLLDEKNKEIMYIAFLECKLKGTWATAQGPTITIINGEGDTSRELLQRAMDENCSVELIVLDGIRRTMGFPVGSMIDIDGNVLIYNNQNVNEIIVDEKEQSGKGPSREYLE